LRFKIGRNGDNIMTPFQCDLCHFRNIKGREPNSIRLDDRKALKFIRRANLDGLWSREPSTVAGNLSQARRMERCGQDIGLGSVAPAMGPFPLEDTFGMQIACVLLRRSLDPGKWEANIQFATARKIRSTYSNVFHSSSQVGKISVMAYEISKTYETHCPTYGYWFERFILGCHKRMGDMVVSDFALSVEIFRELLAGLEEDFQEAPSMTERDQLTEFANLIIFGFCCGLRGEEIVKVDVSGFLKYLEVGADHDECPHVVVPLLGRLKGEMGERYHMMILARETKSGIRPGIWGDRLGACLRRRNRSNGFVFQSSKGRQAKVGDYDDEFLERLVQVRARKSKLFDPGVNVVEVYSLRRSLRRGSTTRATNAGVPKETIEMNNRWRKLEAARGRRQGMSMMSHYTEIRLAIPTLWRYSRML
jgi:hypothetical protein